MPRRNKAPPLPEHENSEHWHQARFISLIRQIPHPAGWLTYAIPNGFLRTKTMRIRAWKEGMLKGVLDVHTPVRSPCGQFPGLWLEFKRKPNVLSEDQERFMAAVIEQGYRAEVVYCWQEALEVFCGYLEITIEVD